MLGPVTLRAALRLTVGTSAVPLTIPQNSHGMIIKAQCPGQTIYISGDPAVSAADGYPMVDGETLTLEVRNADRSRVYAVASAAGQSVALLPFLRL